MKKTSVGDRLKEFRAAVGVSNDELAAVLQVAKNTVSNYMNDVTTIPADKVGLLADAYPALNIEYLVADRGELWLDLQAGADRLEIEDLLKSIEGSVVEVRRRVAKYRAS